MEDLWPDDIESARVTAPVTILKEQAALLGEKTNGLVTADVKPIEDATERHYLPTSDEFFYSFDIFGPVIRYKYRLFTVAYDVGMYPIHINLDYDITKECFTSPEKSQIPSYIKGDSETEFKGILKKIFRSRKMMRIISAINSQSE